MNNRKSIGYTLIEVIVVLGLLILIAGFTVTGFQNYTNLQRYDAAVGTVKIALEEAHSSAKHAVEGVAHGVKISSSEITLFSGDTYDVSNPSNTTISFTDVTVTEALSSGGNEIIFASLTGLPSATGTVTIVGRVQAATTTLTIDATGVIQ